MSTEFSNQFSEVLRTLERERDLEPVLALFAEGATLRRIPRAGSYHGERGIQHFWEEYLDAFSSISTEFGKVIELNEAVVLEWRSQGTTKHGKEVEYEGCTVLELSDGKISAFRTYYDAAASGMGAATLPDEQTEAAVGPATAAVVKPVQEVG